MARVGIASTRASRGERAEKFIVVLGGVFILHQNAVLVTTYHVFFNPVYRLISNSCKWHL